MAQILWSPELGECSQCGCAHNVVRRFTSGGHQTFFCEGCWSEFVEECNVPNGVWQSQVATEWYDSVSLEIDSDTDKILHMSGMN